MIRMLDHDGSGQVGYAEFQELCLNPSPLFTNVDLLSMYVFNNFLHDFRLHGDNGSKGS
jgi:hypothetical protein